MKKTAVAALALSFLMLISVPPVLAIGPWQAVEVDKNPNLSLWGEGVANDKGLAGGSNVWADTGEHFVRWKFLDPLDAKGIMNNAIVATSVDQIKQIIYGTGFDNKWIYLSGDDKPDYPNPNQYQFPDTPATHALFLKGSHGMLWWLFFFSFGGAGKDGLPPNPSAGAIASGIATAFPSGVYWTINDIQQDI